MATRSVSSVEAAEATELVPDRYNREHFGPGVLLAELGLALGSRGPRPGEPAPEFELADAAGRSWRLGELRGRPVVLIFGSGTCPATLGSLPSLKEVYRALGDRAVWLFVYVREAHPGEGMSWHRSYRQKVRQAEEFREGENVPWPVLIDDVDGSVHRAYGMLPNAVFLIDVDGRVAFRGDRAHGPTLRRALAELLERGGHGPVAGGVDHGIHPLGSIIYGWTALRRGGRAAVRDVVLGTPPAAAVLWLGDKLEPILGPLVRRDRALLPRGARVAAGVAGLAGVALLGWWAVRRSRDAQRWGASRLTLLPTRSSRRVRRR